MPHMATQSLTNANVARPSDLPTLLTVKEAAELLGVTRHTLERWGHSGHLPRVEVGPRTVRYRASDIAALIDPENATSPAANPGPSQISGRRLPTCTSIHPDAA